MSKIVHLVWKTKSFNDFYLEAVIMKQLKIEQLFYLLLLAVIFVLLFSTTTSPVYYKPFSVDSAAFQLIGKYWNEGYLPYVDLWDLKGPAIFWINAVGYWMTGSALGVFIIQVFFLTGFLLVAYKMLMMEYSSKWASILTIVILIAGVFSYSDGNTVEEYALPFLMGSFYCLYRWGQYVSIEKTVVYHKPVWAFVYGVTFAFCLLTRVTNAVGMCFGVLVVLFYLICYGAWHNIFKNALAFILGCMLLIIPFAVYFASKGALYDLWYGTILYSIKYYENSSFNFFSLPWKSMIYMVTIWISYVLLFLIGIIKVFFLKRQKIAGLLWLSVSIGTFLWIFTSNGFVHYNIIGIPYICIAMCELVHIKKRQSKGVVRFLNAIAVMSVLLFCVQSVYISQKTFRLLLKIEVNVNNKAYEEILENVPKKEWDSLVAYNVSPEFYLYNGIRPCYKYFGFQDWEVRLNSEFRKLLREPFLSCEAKWIVVENYALCISDILRQHYELVYRSEFNPDFMLYKLKDMEYNKFS